MKTPPDEIRLHIGGLLNNGTVQDAVKRLCIDFDHRGLAVRITAQDCACAQVAY